MNEAQWQIPPSMLRQLSHVPSDRAVVMLVRHSVRDHLPSGDVGYALPINEVGHRLAMEFGELLRGRLRTLHASPLLRCIQTAEALGKGSCVDMAVVPDRHLGDPGVFVIDGQRAWENWVAMGHEGVMHHLVTKSTALPGMARPDEAARFLVRYMLTVAADQPGLHVFVTHDSLVIATTARLLGQPLGVDDWPWYLEGAFFWQDGDYVVATYRDREAVCSVPTLSLPASCTSSQGPPTDQYPPRRSI